MSRTPAVMQMLHRCLLVSIDDTCRHLRHVGFTGDRTFTAPQNPAFRDGKCCVLWSVPALNSYISAQGWCPIWIWRLTCCMTPGSTLSFGRWVQPVTEICYIYPRPVPSVWRLFTKTHLVWSEPCVYLAFHIICIFSKSFFKRYDLLPNWLLTSWST